MQATIVDLFTSSANIMHIEEALPADAPAIASVLQEAAGWLANAGRPLWSAEGIGDARVMRDTQARLFHVARDGEQVAGVMKFELEDAHFWPEIQPGTSAFIHKLAVRRPWAKQGVSTALLAYGLKRARQLGLVHLRVDCVADRQPLRRLYEGFGFTLHSVVRIGAADYARYELSTADATEHPDHLQADQAIIGLRQALTGQFLPEEELMQALGVAQEMPRTESRGRDE